ncbi:MAG: SixA phosphatase family protein [Thermoanaerobaculia bacterium]
MAIRRKKPASKPAKRAKPEAHGNDTPTAADGSKTVRKERFVVLFRHGIAEPREDVSKPDAERSLTKEGNDRMKEIGRGLAELFPKADAIFTSPLVRAVQTALWISKGYGERITVQTTNALIPGASPAELREFLAGTRERRIILVGHEPNLSTNCVDLTGLSGRLELKKGGCYGIRIDEEGNASLEWMLPPKVLRRIG